MFVRACGEVATMATQASSVCRSIHFRLLWEMTSTTDSTPISGLKSTVPIPQTSAAPLCPHKRLRSIRCALNFLHICLHRFAEAGFKTKFLFNGVARLERGRHGSSGPLWQDQWCCSVVQWLAIGDCNDYIHSFAHGTTITLKQSSSNST